MKLILKNSNIVFSQYAEAKLSIEDAYTKFDSTSWNNFLTAIGGKNGTIWKKIKLLFLPVYSREADGNIYYDVISQKIVGLEPAEALKYWKESSDANVSTLKGYVSKYADNISMGVDVSDLGLTTDNVCLFCLSTHNPNPGSSLQDMYTNVIGLHQSTLLYQINSPTESKIFVKASKHDSVFTNTLAVCMYNTDGIPGIVGDGIDDTVASSKISSEAKPVIYLRQGLRETSSSQTWGHMFSVQGIASGLTQAEAKKMVDALVALKASNPANVWSLPLPTGYYPNGQTFSQEIAWDGTKDKLVFVIDGATCTSTNENILSIGTSIKDWGYKSDVKNLHIFFTASSDAPVLLAYCDKTDQINPTNSTNSKIQNYYTVKNKGKFTIAFSKKGIEIDGVLADQFTPYVQRIIGETKLQVGSAQGTDRSKAIYFKAYKTTL